MVTNLPAEAKAKWIKVMEAKTPEEKLLALQEFLSSIPKHKGTEKLVKQVRRKIAELRREIEERERKRKARKKGAGFFIEKEGAAQAVILGLTNSGKSTLLSALTNAKPEISPYPYTTRKPVPGMLDFEDIQFQLIEAPAIIEGTSRGLKAIALARNADALIITISLDNDPIKQLNVILGELEKSGILITKPKGRVEIERKRGHRGIQIVLNGRIVDGTVDDVKRMLLEYGIHGAVVKIVGTVALSDIEKAVFGSAVYKPAIIVATKCDIPGAYRRLKLLKAHLSDEIPVIPFSPVNKECGREIGRVLFNILDIIRIYTKQPNTDEPSRKPLVVRKGITVLEVAKIIHSAFYYRFKYARIWGPSAKYPGERVGGDHVLMDGDVVEIRIK